MIQLYNSLTRKKEEFKPLGEEVKMYVCGVTVYDDSHLGHALSSIVFDVLDRYLEFRGFKVRKVQNFTDVDDKIINRANADEVPWEEITEKYIASFFKSIEGLNVRRATLHPKATEDMPEIIALIKRLVDCGAAYELNGSVYYRVRSKSDYGKLSGQNIDEMLEATRGEMASGKEDPADFALWKAVKPDEPKWDSPYGPGRPGWHIECSAMAFKHLGEQIDIHGGGLDLIFPHHENEIAQSESASGLTPFAGMWMHNGLLRTTGATMSKSLGNAFNVNSALEEFSSDAIRLWILQSHYRTNPLLDKKLIGDAERSMRRVRQAVEAASTQARDAENSLDVESYKRRFTDAMDDDLNTPQALASIFDLCRKMNKARTEGTDIATAAALVRELTSVLGFTLADPPKKGQGLGDAEIQDLVQQRKNARTDKRWGDADAVRDQLEAAGISIADTGGETSWSRN
jgi:cysteinyl-tRNA synthetase